MWAKMTMVTVAIDDYCGGGGDGIEDDDDDKG
jgi:hypothetical protein